MVENLVKIFVLVILIFNVARIIVSIVAGIKYMHIEEKLDEVD